MVYSALAVTEGSGGGIMLASIDRSPLYCLVISPILPESRGRLPKAFSSYIHNGVSSSLQSLLGSRQYLSPLGVIFSRHTCKWVGENIMRRSYSNTQSVLIKVIKIPIIAEKVSGPFAP
jgi:hypothetical protein